MTELEAINLIYRQGLGFSPVSAVSDADGLITDALEERRKELLTRGLPFNRERVDLQRQVDGQIKLPETYLAVALPRPFIVRDKKVYNVEERSHVLDRDFPRTWIAVDVPIEQLPPAAAKWIAWSAAVDVASSKNNARLAYCEDRAQTAEVTLDAEYATDGNEEIEPWRVAGHFGGCCWCLVC